MAFARLVAGTWTEVTGPFTVGDGDDAIQYPVGWLDGASADELAAFGAIAIVEEPAPAAALALLGPVLLDVDGVPHRRWAIPPVADVRAARHAELADYRWHRQQKVKWRGRVAAADDVTLGRLMAAVLRAQLAGDTGFTIRWKFDDGDRDTLSLADVIAYGTAIGTSLQACYDREEELAAVIAAAPTPAAVAAVDITGGWPA